ncbi:hypothetical protein EVAR_3490_1 [Eumeta japonica]|uniref:Uncharacterized protein n=1 Tax=Eumeta variegata TaxID=151549 RepID=A0A4C1STA8_EUMVA|nr:hypothetical protein EVAR_3490_1 [Eumeta japonica]
MTIEQQCPDIHNRTSRKTKKSPNRESNVRHSPIDRSLGAHRINRIVGVATFAVATGRHVILGNIYSLVIVECTVWQRVATLCNGCVNAAVGQSQLLPRVIRLYCRKPGAAKACGFKSTKGPAAGLARLGLSPIGSLRHYLHSPADLRATGPRRSSSTAIRLIEGIRWIPSAYAHAPTDFNLKTLRIRHGKGRTGPGHGTYGPLKRTTLGSGPGRQSTARTRFTIAVLEISKRLTCTRNIISRLLNNTYYMKVDVGLSEVIDMDTVGRNTMKVSTFVSKIEPKKCANDLNATAFVTNTDSAGRKQIAPASTAATSVGDQTYSAGGEPAHRSSGPSRRLVISHRDFWVSGPRLAHRGMAFANHCRHLPVPDKTISGEKRPAGGGRVMGGHSTYGDVLLGAQKILQEEISAFTPRVTRHARDATHEWTAIV